MTDKPIFRPEIEGVSLRDALGDTEVLQWDDLEGLTPVTGVTVDSSDVAPGWVFVAIGGAKRHGIRFALQAVQAGAAAVVTDKLGFDQAKEIGVPIVTVAEPRAAAGQMARRIYGPKFTDMTLIGVTGTNGKTTTSYLIKAALEKQWNHVGLMGTVEIDVDEHPVIARRTTAEAPVVYQALAVASENNRGAAVIEASSHALSLNRVDGLVFDSVVFTNLQHDHLDFYGTMEDYYRAKASLFDPHRARKGVVCVDDEWGQRLATEAKIPVQTVSALKKGSPTFEGQPNHWQVTSALNEPDKWGVAFTLRDPSGVEHECFCPIPGMVNVQNSAVAIVAATEVGVPLDQAIAGLAKTAPIPGRMEIIPTVQATQPRVLVDYAHTPEALEALLQTVRPFVTDNLVVVFGTDGDRDASKREDLAEFAAQYGDILWVTDENPRSEDPAYVRQYLMRGIKRVRPNFENVFEVTTCRRDAVREAIQSAKAGDLVVITGKGAEPTQEVMGVFHAYMDSVTAKEVVASLDK